MVRPDAKSILLGAALLCCTVLSALYGLGSYSLIDPDEPRYAQAAREMIARGDYLVPYLNGEPRLNKPPVFYWLEVVSYKALGGDSELAARLPSALAAIAMGLAVYFLARNLWGKTAALFAVPVLFSMPLFAGVTRLATTDATMTAFFTAALCFWWRSRQAARTIRNVALSWLFLALAVLAKGPVALALFVLIVCVFCVLRGEWAGLRRSFHPLGLLIFFAVTLPWPVLVLATRPESASLWYRETVERFVSGVDHGGARLWPVAVLFAGTMPWCLLAELPAGARFRNALRSLVGDERVLFPVVWVGVVVVFFGVCQTQLVTYVLPAVPGVAAGVAGRLALAFENKTCARAGLMRAAAGWLAMTLSAVAYGVFTAKISPGEIAAIGFATLIGVTLLGVLFARGYLRAVAAGLTCAVALAVIGASVFVLEKVSLERSFRGAVQTWDRQFRAAEEIGFCGPLLSKMSLVYYAAMPVRHVKTKLECTGALGGGKRTAIVLYEKTLGEVVAQDQPDAALYVSGRCTVGGSAFALVTNFPVAGAAPDARVPIR